MRTLTLPAQRTGWRRPRRPEVILKWGRIRMRPPICEICEICGLHALVKICGPQLSPIPAICGSKAGLHRRQAKGELHQSPDGIGSLAWTVVVDHQMGGRACGFHVGFVHLPHAGQVLLQR